MSQSQITNKWLHIAHIMDVMTLKLQQNIPVALQLQGRVIKFFGKTARSCN